MSTKMYNYRIRKDAWWSFVAAVREFYLAEYPVFKVLAEVSEGDGITYSKFVEAVDVFKDWTVELQLFDEGDHWLIRPLEQGYFFMNGHEQWVEEFGLETVWYDDRSDVPPEDEKNRPVSEWVDENIRAHRYLIHPLVERDDFMNVYLDKWLSA